MPVILDPGSEDLRTWLDPSRHEWSAELQSLLKPFKGSLDVYPVSKDVGKVGNNSPSFIIPIDSKENKSNIANFFSNATPKKAAKPKDTGHVDTTDEVAAKIKAEESPAKSLATVDAKHSPGDLKRKHSPDHENEPLKKAFHAPPEKPAASKTRSATKNEARGTGKTKPSGTPKITSFFAANSA